MRHTKKEIMAGVEDVVKSRVIENNTIRYHKSDGTRVIRLHFTDIVTFHPDDSITLNSNGYQTPTTKDRMNRFSPFQIYQEKNIWYVVNNYGEGETHVFADGITFYLNGTVKGEGEDPKVFIKLNKEINKYVKGYMTALVNRQIRLPSGGDCWDCYMKGDDGRTMGDMKKFNPGEENHITSHFKEKYYVPTLLINAMEEFGCSQAAQHAAGFWMGAHSERSEFFESVGKDQIAKSMKRYLKRRLGMAS